MKKILFFIILFTTFKASAHKDRMFLESEGTVIMYMKSPFDYAESEKVKIITKLASELAKSLNEKDTILIRYNHNQFPKSFVPTYLLEYKKTTFISNGNNRLIYLQIENDNVDIEEILYLIDFGIKNKYKLKKYLDKVSDYSYETLKKTNSYKITSNSFITSLFIYEKGSNDFVKKLLTIGFDVFEDENFKISWKNKMYSITPKNKKDKFEVLIRDDEFYSYQVINEGLIFFKNNSTFSFFTNEGVLLDEKIIQKTNKVYFAYKEKKSDDFYIMNTYYGKEKYLFKINEDKVIEKE
jgi:hypothetical protein